MCCADCVTHVMEAVDLDMMKQIILIFCYNFTVIFSLWPCCTIKYVF